MSGSIGGHHSAKPKSVEWMTPPSTIISLGGRESFDIDPCAPEVPLLPCARRHCSRKDNGLALPWEGRAWVNPPYTTEELEQWLARLADHNHGTALIFARTETATFSRHVWGRASAVLFIKGRLHFHVNEDTWLPRKNGPDLFIPAGHAAPANSGAPSVLVAYGQDDMDILAGCTIEGQFVPLRFNKSVLVEAITASWRELVRDYLAEREGTIEVADLYRAFADHPKAKANPHYREKLRQTLQRGEGKEFVRADRGQWQLNLEN